MQGSHPRKSSRHFKITVCSNNKDHTARNESTHSLGFFGKMLEDNFTTWAQVMMFVPSEGRREKGREKGL